ncbi:hypothetical protein Q4485_03795 [Granulosicoccaceae sp. 1_MG-2023]|nr:hypothetical protein [Granulosicoccaceae sp. 1_MG-2023]
MGDYVGLFPAAGRGTRLGLQGISKEIVAVSLHGETPRPVGLFLLEAWQRAGIEQAIVISRPGKEDIQTCFTRHTGQLPTLHYIHATEPWGTPFTLDSAYPLLQGRNVALGFPDILMQPDDAFGQLKNRFEAQDCDVLLGLFPATAPARSDMVELGADRQVRRLHIKPARTSLQLTWAIALWRPVFSAFLHDYIRCVTPQFHTPTPPAEPFVGDVINAAIEAGLRVAALPLQNARMLDIGTPQALAKAQRSAFP